MKMLLSPLIMHCRVFLIHKYLLSGLSVLFSSVDCAYCPHWDHQGPPLTTATPAMETSRSKE